MGFCSLRRQPAQPPVRTEPLPQPAVVIPAPQEASGTGEQVKTPIVDEALVQKGVASWYGGDFHGRQTANGEIYDMNKLTAAHQTIPFNTILEVENLENQKKVLVRINDRGPFLKNRIIDLSYAAAERLGMADTGTASVVLRILKPGAPLTARYYLQLGAFRERANAEALVAQVATILPDLSFSIMEEEGLFKVVSLKVDSRTKAEQLRETLEPYAIESIVKETLIP